MRFILCLFIIHACTAMDLATIQNDPAILANALLAAKKDDGTIHDKTLAEICDKLIKKYKMDNELKEQKTKENKKIGFFVEDQASSAKVLYRTIVVLGDKKYFLKIAKLETEIVNLANLSKNDFKEFKISEINGILNRRGIFFKLAKPVASKIIVDKNRYYVTVQELAEGSSVKELIEEDPDNSASLKTMLTDVGKAIGTFHLVNLVSKDKKFYSRTHGDLHLNNIFYQAGPNSIVTFIDLETMAKSLNEPREIGEDLNKLLGYLFHRWKHGTYAPEVSKSILNSIVKNLVRGYISAFTAEQKDNVVKYIETYFDSTSIVSKFGKLFKILKDTSFKDSELESVIEEIEVGYAGSLANDEDARIMSSVDNICSQYRDICIEEMRAACERKGITMKEKDKVKFATTDKVPERLAIRDLD